MKTATFMPARDHAGARGATRGVPSVALAFVVALAWICLAGLEAQGAEDYASLVGAGDKAFSRGDVAGAMQSYRQAAEAGYAPAQAKLGFILDQAEENQEAAQWFAKAAAQGSADGRFGLGQLHLVGEGVPKDEKRGIALLKEAADGGSLLANLSLARTYESGGRGLAKSPADALRHWRQAAQLGERSAMERLATAYRKGELGLAPEESAAKAWESRAKGDTTVGVK